MTNLYHILYKEPIYNFDGIKKGYEDLANQLVSSGLLRVDAHNKINYARFSVPSKNYNKMFSSRELYEEHLLFQTKKTLQTILQTQFSSKELAIQIKKHINIMRNELKKYQYVDSQLELKLARIIVQSAHPVILKLILLEKVEVFISYSHNIGDMLDTYSWQTSGENSGMQSTDGYMAAIFISSGGDPFAKTENLYYGNGKPALARMTIIAAQEIGHYADLIRDKYGHKSSRFSMNLNRYQAREPVKSMRLKDIKNVSLILYDIKNKNYLMKKLYDLEESLKFFKNNRKGDIIIFTTKIKTFVIKFLAKIFVGHKYRVLFKEFLKQDYLALGIVDMLHDMQFNLTPQADVYRNTDKVIEEAIQCAEALARVPQQVVKWGDNITKYIYPNLYNFYYNEVIPYNIHAYEKLSNAFFTFNNTKLRIPFRRKILNLFFKS